MVEWHMLDKIFKNIFLTINKPFPEICRYIKSKNEVAVVLFGDSVSKRVAGEDIDKRTLQEIIEKELFTRKISANYFSGKGFHLRLFRHFVSAMQKNDKKPWLIVIPVNMRCFSPQWIYHPHWQFETEIRIFCRKFAIPYTAPAVKLPDTSDEYWKIPISCHQSNYSTVGDFMKVIKRKKGLDDNEILFRRQQLFIFHYMYKLSSDNDRICSLNTILKDSNFRFLLYFTPLNCSGGSDLLGSAFSDVIEEHKKIIMNGVLQVQANQNNIYIKDYTKLFDSSYFFTKYDPTEHLNESGRKRLSILLAEDIEGIISTI